MSLIERDESIWLCPTHGQCSVAGAVEGPYAVCIECRGRVTKYVPASQLAGAVEEIERLREELAELRHENEALEESLLIARQERDAYRRAGGQ